MWSVEFRKTTRLSQELPEAGDYFCAVTKVMQFEKRLL